MHGRGPHVKHYKLWSILELAGRSRMAYASRKKKILSLVRGVLKKRKTPREEHGASLPEERGPSAFTLSFVLFGWAMSLFAATLT